MAILPGNAEPDRTKIEGLLSLLEQEIVAVTADLDEAERQKFSGALSRLQAEILEPLQQAPVYRTLITILIWVERLIGDHAYRMAEASPMDVVYHELQAILRRHDAEHPDDRAAFAATAATDAHQLDYRLNQMGFYDCTIGG